jgi:integrase
MHITTSSLKGLRYEKANNKADVRFDDDLRGFGVRIYPSGRISYVISYRTLAGEKKRITIGDHSSLSVKQARELAKDRLHEIRKGRDPALERRALREEPTFERLAEEYLVYVADHKRSIKSDRQRLRDHILPEVGRRKLSDINLAHFQQLHRATKARTSASTANRCAALIKHICTLAVEWGYLGSNPAKHLRLFREPPPREVVLTPEECRQFIDACEQDENIFARALFLLCMFTGRRIGEIQQAKWSDFHPDRAILTIHETKAGERQHIVLDAVAVRIIKEIPRLADNPYIIAGSKIGRPINFYRRAWDRIIKRTSIAHFSPHGLRHNYASALVAAGIPLDTVRHLLGHKSALTTQKYAHHRDDNLRAASGVFSSSITQPEKGLG